ncbi:MAG: amidase [Spirochaetes bacterium]|nr:MAG: amidase [Spirochaetota bacterium]
MVYNLSKLKAPRMTGRALKIFTSVLESNFPGKIIIKKIMDDSGISYLANKKITEEPTYFPIHGYSTNNVDGRKDVACYVSTGDYLKSKYEIKKTDSFRYLGIDDYADLYKNKKITPIDVAENLLKIIDIENEGDSINAIIKLDKEDFLKQAADSAERLKSGKPRSILEGVPIAVKDEIDAQPYTTDVGTSFLGKAPASADAEVVRRLRDSGALIFGKTNMHEIGIGVTGINPHFGSARNPHNPKCYTGGSSSGSAAAVAAGYCPAAIGADGGGSIRIPAALCGVTGLKPTFGRVSERGAAPLCWSVAHIGPIGATPRDTALLYAVIAGKDKDETLTMHQPKPNLFPVDKQNIEGLRIGIYPEWFYDCDKTIYNTLKEAISKLKEIGVNIVTIEVPELEEMRIAQLVTIVSEMTTAMAPYDKNHRKDFGLDVRTNLAMGRSFTNVDYIHAQRMRTKAINIFSEIFKDVDCIITPTTAITAPVIPKDTLPDGESDLSLLSDIMRFAGVPNLIGYPAISVPVGYDEANMPIGLQFIGRPWEEALLLEIAGILERKVETRKPEVYRSPIPTA